MGDFFFWLVCFFFLCCIRIILGSQASPKIILFNIGSNVEFLGYKKSSQVLKCSESIEEHEEVKTRAWGWGAQWWLHRDQLLTAAVKLCGALRSALGHMQRAGGT